MSASAAEVHFAAEFVTFLAAAVGIAVVLLRGDLLTAARSRPLLGAGFGLLGMAAFLHGSTILDASADRAELFALRFFGVGALAVAAGRWTGPARGQRLFSAGLAVLAAATFVGLANAAIATSLMLAAGSVVMGAGVVDASRRSIASRVAASASITLLIVVLVLAVGISAVLTSTVQDQARVRLSTRAASEAGFAADPEGIRIIEAGVAAASLKANLVDAIATSGDPHSAALIATALTTLSTNFFNSSNNNLAMVYVDGNAAPVATTNGFPTGAAIALAGSAPVKETLTDNHKVGSVTTEAGQVYSLGIAPISVNVQGVPKRLGAVIVVSPLNSGYIEQRLHGETDLGGAIATREGFAASFGPPPRFNAARGLVNAVLENPSQTATADIGGRFVAAAALRASDQHPVAVELVWQPTTVVADTRQKLYRILFLIALVGALVALALAALVGNRVGAGLRRHTVAAGAIQGGDLTARAAIDADDEVGALGSAFDSMAMSIQDKTSELAEARNRLEAVVAGMGEALIATDADGRVTEFNRSAEELLGVSAGEAKGMPVDEVLAMRADDGSPLAERLRKPSPRRWSIEGDVMAGHDESVPVSLSAGVLRGPDDDLVGSVYVVRDLRREREVERMKTEFLSRIGHELRTPLTGIKGYAELLARKEVPPERARVWLEEILKQSEALVRIVQMLEFHASTGAGRVMLRPEQVNLRDVIDDVVTRHSARANGHKITKRVGRGVPKIVADERWITQSIDELVDNAVKFSPDGGRVSVTAAMTDEGELEIAVADKGKGMSREELALAFSAFAQGDSSDTRRFGGLGLGLSLVQRVAEAHGGTVTVASTPGKGSKVSILLPVVPIEERR
jgi:two-component system sensor histidine kinase VicK